MTTEVSGVVKDVHVSGTVSRLRPLVENPATLLTLFVVVLCVVFSSMTSKFATGSNVVAIISGTADLAIISLGQTFAMIVGGFDLSVAGVAPLAAVVFALLSNAGWPTIPAIVAVVALGAFVGLINGAIISWAKINPLITTLGTFSIAGGAAYAVSSGVTVALNNASAAFLANSLPGNIPVYVIVTIALAILGGLLLRFTKMGRSIYAVGGNRSAAWLAGIRVNGVTLAVFAICGGLAALAGVIVTSELLAGSGTVEANAALESIAAVVLGGAALTGGEGGVIGTMLGVIVIAIIGNGLQLIHISAFYQQIATGAILLIAVGIQRLRRVASRTVTPGRQRSVPGATQSVEADKGDNSESISSAPRLSIAESNSSAGSERHS